MALKNQHYETRQAHRRQLARPARKRYSKRTNHLTERGKFVAFGLFAIALVAVIMMSQYVTISNGLGL